MTRIAISESPSCREAADAAEQWLVAHEANVRLFDSAGRDLEAAIGRGEFDAVLDLATPELLDSDPRTQGSGVRDQRFIAAIRLGLPLVISVAGLSHATAEELDLVGKMIVERASAARAPTRILLPLGETAEPMQALFQSIRNWVYPPELLVEVHQRINEPEFGVTAAKLLWQIVGGVR